MMMRMGMGCVVFCLYFSLLFPCCLYQYFCIFIQFHYTVLYTVFKLLICTVIPYCIYNIIYINACRVVRVLCCSFRKARRIALDSFVLSPLHARFATMATATMAETMPDTAARQPALVKQFEDSALSMTIS